MSKQLVKKWKLLISLCLYLYENRATSRALPGGLELINEDFISTVEVDDKPVAPPRPNRLSQLVQQDSTSPRDIVSPTLSEKSVVERIEAALHHNYYVIAYSIIIVAVSVLSGK